MCGIAGILRADGPPARPAEVGAMCDAMVHRGPDDSGVYSDPSGDVALGMRRLSIIDVHSGHQPIGNEDRSIWAVHNGEIYNFEQLRRQLQSRGHTFATRSDTEVIVHLYEEYGEHFVEWLRGMFGLALWDSRHKVLIVARDRLGIKPLYYGWAGRRLVFASELKALLQLPEVQRRVDVRSFGYLLGAMTTPPAESIIEGIHKLEPAHYLRAQLREAESPPSLRKERYWRLQFKPVYRPLGELFEEFRELLRESVDLHRVSDVPLGALLSGGVDSSSIVAELAKVSERPVKTFSIGFDVSAYNELPHARQIAERFGTDHHELVLEPNALDIIDDIAWYLDEPFGDSSAIPTYMVSKLAANEVTVALSGDGGDELFAGYDKYAVERSERAFDGLPGFAKAPLGFVGRRLAPGAYGRNFLIHHGLRGRGRYFDAVSLFRDDAKARVAHPDVAAQIFEDCPQSRKQQWLDTGHWLSDCQNLDLHTYLPLDILTKVDRMSMAHSLETRVPLLDHRIVEFAASLPPEVQMPGGQKKFFFRQAMRRELPKATLLRPKQGFAVPLARWFRGAWQGILRDTLLSERSVQRGFLRPNGIEELLRLQRAGRNVELQLWTLLSFELWCQRFLDQPVRPRRA